MTAIVTLTPVATGHFFDGNAIVNNVFIAKNLGYTAVNDPVGANDGDTSFVQIPPNADGARWSFVPSRPSQEGASNIDTISKVSITGVLRKGIATPANVNLFISVGGKIKDGDVIAAPTSYATKSLAFTTNPITNAAWDKADFESQIVEIGCARSINGGDSTVNLTQLYLTIEYIPLGWSTIPPASGSWSASSAASGGWVPFPSSSGGWTKM